jgi:hypothetical protein
MPTIVEAKVGDTLCGLAIAAGFIDCAPLRSDPANAGKEFLNRDLKPGDFITIPDVKLNVLAKAAEALHLFKKKNAPPMLIRFTHGSKDKPYREDKTETGLNISNWPTDKAGKKADKSFPTGTKFQQDADDDLRTFKVEVVDPKASGKIEVELRALKPVLKPDGTIEKHERFTGAEEGKRKLTVSCEPVPSKVCFRSPYLRLVVDEKDRAAASDQTLLVTDMADGKDGAEDKIELLDQLVEASYTRKQCPAGTKCRVVVQVPIGGAHQRVMIAVHVLKNALGVAVAKTEDVRKRVLNKLRQVYAQGDVSIKQVETIREVPLPGNMFAVANGNGQLAEGGKTIKVRVRVDADVDQTVSITTVKDASPLDTATALEAEILKAIPGGKVQVKASGNPPVTGQAIGSADVLIGKPISQKVRLNVLQSDDAGHPVIVGQLTSTTVTEFGGADSHVGTIAERVLVKNYDTGSDRIDLFVVEKLSDGSFGEAFTPNSTQPVGEQPMDLMINSCLVNLETINKANFERNTIPHEIGHIIMDVGHADTRGDLMLSGSSPIKTADDNDVGGRKRLTHPRKVKFDNGVEDSSVNRLQTANASLMTAW